MNGLNIDKIKLLKNKSIIQYIKNKMSGQIKNQELKSNQMNMDMEELWNDYIKPDHINLGNIL